MKKTNNVDHPKHYTEHPSGVEAIEITEWMNFCLGNAMKYIWRADLKGGLEDLQKAAWYINREIQRRTNEEYKKPIPKLVRGKHLPKQVRPAQGRNVGRKGSKHRTGRNN